MWLCILQDEGKLRWLFAVWGFYTWLALVPITGINFGLVDDNLDKNDFLGPNVLIMSLCVSPLLFLLLLNNASDSSDFRKLVFGLSFQCWMLYWKKMNSASECLRVLKMPSSQRLVSAFCCLLCSRRKLNGKKTVIGESEHP